MRRGPASACQPEAGWAAETGEDEPEVKDGWFESMDASNPWGNNRSKSLRAHGFVHEGTAGCWLGHRRTAGAWARHHFAPIILPLRHQPIQGQDHGGKMIKGTSSRCFGRTRIGGSRERAAWVRRVGGVAAGLLS